MPCRPAVRSSGLTHLEPSAGYVQLNDVPIKHQGERSAYPTIFLWRRDRSALFDRGPVRSLPG